MRRYQRSRADLVKRAGIRGTSATQFASLPICLRHGHVQSRASTLAGKILGVAERQSITGDVDEMIVMFGKIAAVVSRKSISL